MYRSVSLAYMSVYHLHAVTVETKRGIRSPGTGLGVAMWVLEIKPESSGQLASALKHRAFSPASIAKANPFCYMVS